jgi:hypothetical protein
MATLKQMPPALITCLSVHDVSVFEYPKRYAVRFSIPETIVRIHSITTPFLYKAFKVSSVASFNGLNFQAELSRQQFEQ